MRAAKKNAMIQKSFSLLLPFELLKNNDIKILSDALQILNEVIFGLLEFARFLYLSKKCRQFGTAKNKTKLIF